MGAILETTNLITGGSKMKSLGIVRKIDELGRVVIPKEVRDTQGWPAGQPMEMFMSDDGLMMRAYGADHEQQEILTQLHAVKSVTQSEAVKKIIENTIDFIAKK